MDEPTNKLPHTPGTYGGCTVVPHSSGKQNTCSVNVDGYLAELRGKFPEANFSIDSDGDGAYRSGIHNFRIARNVLEHMATDSQFRLVFEDLFAAQIDLNKTTADAHELAGRELVAHGVVVRPDGSFSTWSSVSVPDQSQYEKFAHPRAGTTRVQRTGKNSYMETISWGLRTA